MGWKAFVRMSDGNWYGYQDSNKQLIERDDPEVLFEELTSVYPPGNVEVVQSQTRTPAGDPTWSDAP